MGGINRFKRYSYIYYRMAQVMPPEVDEILALRHAFRAGDVRARFSDEVLAVIDEIRTDIPSSEDRDGWVRVGNGQGHPPGNVGRNKPRDAFRGINSISPVLPPRELAPVAATAAVTGPTTHAPGSYRPKGSSERPRFMSSRPNPVTAAAAPVTHAAPHAASHPGPHVRYTSRFKNKENSVESTIVNTIILNKLNKFSHSNYNEVKDFLMEILASGETDFLSDFMHLIFTKAAAEEIYCPLYAELLKELAEKYPFLLTEMMNIYNKFIDIFEEISEEACKDTEEFIKKNKEKKYRKGYSQFVTELYKKGILTKDAFMLSLRKIAENMALYAKEPERLLLVDEFSASFLRICKAIHKNCIRNDIRALIDNVLAPLMESVNVKSETYPSLTKKIQFAVLDSRDACGAGAGAAT